MFKFSPRAWERTQSINCKHEDLSSNPWDPHKCGTGGEAYNFSSWEVQGVALDMLAIVV